MERGGGEQYDFGDGEDSADSADDEDDDVGTIWPIRGVEVGMKPAVKKERSLRTFGILNEHITKRRQILKRA